MYIFVLIQGKQRKEYMVFCSLVTRNGSFLTGSNQHIYRFTSLPPENKKKCKDLDNYFHSWDFPDCVVLSYPGKMGLYPPRKNNFRAWISAANWTGDFTTEQTKGNSKWALLRKALEEMSNAKRGTPFFWQPLFHFFLLGL